MAEPTSTAPTKPTKLGVRNIGLMLSVPIEAPILDADALIAENGRITAFGKEKDLHLAGS